MTEVPLKKVSKGGDAAPVESYEEPLPLDINLSWCKACNLCIVLCPKHVFEQDRDGKPVQARPEDCNQCAICWLHCPDFAIVSNVK